ncbi:unnamed protein product [Miscanthus lutarioriparius]|uniref:Uncharacterized protein n=1 Tax=Miscanthus lutarioriparius TaxID=422564 RepID=A0A811QVE6_9POAL|nr:unnamed protein product [Miscanthus lutarioriparius]
MSQLQAAAASSSGAPTTPALEADLEGKLLLHDDNVSPPAAPPQIKRGERRQPREGGADVVGDQRERFLRAYDRLRDELLDDDSCDCASSPTRPGAGSRSFKHVHCYLMISWMILIQGEIRFVGLHGINDGIVLKCHIARLIKKYFREKPYYIDICELWNEIALQTSLGQMLDLISTHNVANDVAKYNIEVYRRIVKYKTSYYSFYLPVACALLLYGAKLENFSGLRDVLIEMGIYFQAQDDYLDCFADPNTIGKIGTDIEDHKCSWLIVQALGHANSDEIEVLLKNYGKKDSTSVSKVKNTYSTLDLKDIFSEFEDRAYKHLVTSIEAQNDRTVQEILKSFLKKIHRRKK